MPERPSPATSLAVTAVALAAAGAVHLRFGPSHLEEDALYGAFFLGTGASQLIAAFVVGGVGARGRPLSGRLHWVVVGLNASIILVWALTRVSGPSFGADAGQRESVEYPDLLAVALQLVVIAGLVLAGSRPTITSGRLRRSAIVAAVVTTAIAAPLVAQAVPVRHSELCESHDDGPDVGPLAAVYGHAMIEPPRPPLHTTVGEEVTAIVGKLLNCGEEPVVVTSAEQIDAVNVGLLYDGQVVEQPFATILRVQIGEQP